MDSISIVCGAQSRTLCKIQLFSIAYWNKVVIPDVWIATLKF